MTFLRKTWGLLLLAAASFLYASGAHAESSCSDVSNNIVQNCGFEAVSSNFSPAGNGFYDIQGTGQPGTWQTECCGGLVGPTDPYGNNLGRPQSGAMALWSLGGGLYFNYTSPGTGTYYFSFWAYTGKATSTKFNLFSNGQAVASNLSGPVGQWTQFSGSFIDTTRTAGQGSNLFFNSGCCSNDFGYDNVVLTYGAPPAVPEPATAALFGAGALGVWAARRRSRKS